MEKYFFNKEKKYIIRIILVHIILIFFSVFLKNYLNFVVDNWSHSYSLGETNYIKFIVPPIAGFRSLNESNVILSKAWFSVFGIVLTILTIFLIYHEWRLGSKVWVYIFYRTKNQILEKYHNLDYETKIENGNRMQSIINEDLSLYVRGIRDLYSKPLNNLLGMFFTIFFWHSKIKELTKEQWFFFSICSLMFILLIYYIVKKNDKIEKENRVMYEEENNLISKARTKGVLADCMGLTLNMRTKEKDVFFKSLKRKESTFFFKAFEYVPYVFFKNVFPFALLLFSNNSFHAVVVHAIMNIFDIFETVTYFALERTVYNVSKKRIESFLNLPELNNNENGVKIELGTRISKIEIVDLCFKYRQQERMIFSRYNHTFFLGFNRFSGSNGIGKSTLIRIILGVIKPISGKVFIHTVCGKKYDLFSEINLKHWREKNIVYLSHETLIEEGSTGERQWKNILSLLEKKDASLIIMDEADSALDSEKQGIIKKKIDNLSEIGKTILYIRHLENQKSES